MRRHPRILGLMKKRAEILKQFGERVRELRLKAGLSQEAFADKCDLDRTYVGGIERGERNLSLKNIARVAAALELPISKLFE
jgi:transcriptional regulator with XRE-family HTH domain